MAIQNVLITYTVQDADGDSASVPLYGTFDDGTVTLSALVGYAQGRASELNDITDAKPTKIAITLYPPLPSGMKASPVAGSDVEKTGLLTFNLVSPSGKAYGQDIPGFFDAGFSGDVVNPVGTEIEAWVDSMTSGVLAVTVTNDFWTSTLDNLRKGVKSFRKLGR
jgi:hypothetical protein